MDAPPCIFLSHSGEQKDFTRRLYRELLHVGHSAFFDQDAQDSLPKGQPFPPRIVQACRGCRIGIVVLSDKYLESLWPMLELEQLTFYNPSSHCILYPLFYSLAPADLSNKNKLRKWQTTWDSKALEWQSKVKEMHAASTPSTSHLQISINISTWPEALQRLRYQSGDVFHPLDMDDHAYIRMVVSNICQTIPPPRARYLLDEHIKGMVRLQQEIDDHFQQALPKSGNSKSAVCLGVWGLGGSGKTTLCKNMANFYRRDFPGRSCLLALPTDQKDEKLLVEAMKEVILTLGRDKKDEIANVSSVEMIMSHLEEGLGGHQMFLAIDNVWDWTIGKAKQIVSMAYKVAGSKILVTSRSKQVLEKVLFPRRKIVPVPSITEDEAVEVLKCSSFCLPDAIPELELDLKGLAQLCFFEGQCHPLLLKMMGDMLRRRSGRVNHEQGWKNLISRLQTRPILDDTILEVLETSLLALTPKLQSVFIDLVTCTPRSFTPFEFKHICKWLSMIHDGSSKMDMRDQLIELEYHGLLEIKEDEPNIWQQISIHDLHKNVARRSAGGRDACFFDGCLSDLSIDDYKCRTTKYIHISVKDTSELGSSLMRILTHCSKLEILAIVKKFDKRPVECIRLSVQSMQYLRFLELNACDFSEEIEGWEGTPNLVSLKLSECRFLQNIGDMGCLRKLEKLIILRSRYCAVPDVTQCGELKKLYFHGLHGLKHVASLGQPPKLKELKLCFNLNLKDVRTICTFTALRKLDLSGSDIDQLMEGMVYPLTDLEELVLTFCSKLKRIPNLTNLARLKVFKATYCMLETVELGSFLQVLELGDLQQLRELTIGGSNCYNISSLDVSGLRSLEVCFLSNLRSLEEISGVDSLPKLKSCHFMDAHV